MTWVRRSTSDCGSVCVAGEERRGRGAAGPAARTRSDVIQFKRPSLAVAVGTAVLELLQHIRADFPPEQLTSLIFDSGNLRVLEGCCVERDALHLDTVHRGPAEPPPRP